MIKLCRAPSGSRYRVEAMMSGEIEATMDAAAVGGADHRKMPKIDDVADRDDVRLPEVHHHVAV